MAKSALHPWVEARPWPLKGASKKAFCAFLLFCTVFSQRTPNETHSYTTRKHPVISFTPTTHSINYTQLVSAAVITVTDATTREKLPEASPKGPGSMHFRALAGQRPKNIRRTLVTQGLASRSPKPETKQLSPENENFYNQQLTIPPTTCLTLQKIPHDPMNSSYRTYTRKRGGRRTRITRSYKFSNFPLNPNLTETTPIKSQNNTPIIYDTFST